MLADLTHIAWHTVRALKHCGSLSEESQEQAEPLSIYTSAYHGQDTPGPALMTQVILVIYGTGDQWEAAGNLTKGFLGTTVKLWVCIFLKLPSELYSNVKIKFTLMCHQCPQPPGVEHAL